MTERFLGMDVGSETVKIVELIRDATGLTVNSRLMAEHRKQPADTLRQLLLRLDGDPMNPDIVEDFACELHAASRERSDDKPLPPTPGERSQKSPAPRRACVMPPPPRDMAAFDPPILERR